MNKNTSVIMASVMVAVLAVGIAASVTQSVVAARNVAWGTDGDSGGNGGAGQTGGTANSGPATGDQDEPQSFVADKHKTGPTQIIIGEYNGVGCGHIGGSGSSSEHC
jgi:hypothetical protein